MTKSAAKYGDLFNVGEMVINRETGKAKIVRHVKFCQKGEMLLGFGKVPLGLVPAAEYRKYDTSS